jgi:hypothetical protein
MNNYKQYGVLQCEGDPPPFPNAVVLKATNTYDAPWLISSNSGGVTFQTKSGMEEFYKARGYTFTKKEEN